MLPQHESSVRGVLASRGAQNVTVEGKSVREFVKEILADELKSLKKVRLTWNPESIGEPLDPSLKIGELCKWKPYIGPIGSGRYYIQNAKVLLANGTPANMAEISGKKKSERIVDGKGNFLRDQEFKSDIDMVEEAMASYLSIALRLDPNLCRFCAQFTTEDRNQYIRHVRKAHRNEFEKMMKDADESEFAAEAAEAEPEDTKKKSRVVS